MAIPDASVRYFNSAMTGAPTLNAASGSLIAVLDACLVNGFGAVNISSIVVSANVATVTCQAAHNLSMAGSTGPVVRISGVDSPPALNGDWRVATIPSGSTFTFATEDLASGGASGASMAVKRAPAGWTKPYSDANSAVYRWNAVTGTGRYIKLTDGQDISYRVFSEMTDINGGVAESAAVTAVLAYNSPSSVPWVVIADDVTMYVFAQAYISLARAGYILYAIGEFSSLYQPNAWNTMITVEPQTQLNAGNTYGIGVTRDVFGAPATPVAMITCSYNGWVGVTGASVLLPDTGHVLLPLHIMQATYGIFGTFRGVYRSSAGIGIMPQHLSILPTAIGHDVVVIAAYCENPEYSYSGRLLVDITGPW